MTRTFSRSGKNKYRTEEEVCEGRWKTRIRGMECTQAGKSPGKVDGRLMRTEGVNLGQMFMELRRGGISIMMFNVGLRYLAIEQWRSEKSPQITEFFCLLAIYPGCAIGATRDCQGQLETHASFCLGERQRESYVKLELLERQPAAKDSQDGSWSRTGRAVEK